MNNSELKFDPQTGQPLNTSEVQQPIASTQPVQPQQTVAPVQPVMPTPTNQQQQPVQTQVNVVPTIEQSETDFINNVQAVSSEQQEEKAGGLNYAFIVILFVAVLAAILFLFPLLS